LVTVILTIQLTLPGVNSLKEKRHIIKSLITHIRNSFNVSVAEVAENDILRRTTMGIAVVSNNNSFGHRVVSKVVNLIEKNPEIIILDYQTESY